MTRNVRIDPMFRPSWSRACSTMYLDGLWHDFQTHAGILDAADEAMDKIAEFLDVQRN